MLSLFKWLSLAWVGCWGIVLGIIAICYIRTFFKRIRNE